MRSPSVVGLFTLGDLLRQRTAGLVYRSRLAVPQPSGSFWWGDFTVKVKVSYFKVHTLVDKVSSRTLHLPYSTLIINVTDTVNTKTRIANLA